jgi:ATP synthase protein I
LTAEVSHGYTRPALGGGPGRRDPYGDMWGGWSTGFAISATLLAGVVIYGFAGYWIDRLVGTPKVFTAVGMLLGAALGTYIVYLRYGRDRENKR